MNHTVISPAIRAEAERQHTILSQGCAAIYPQANDKGYDGLFYKLVTALQEDRPLKIKFGMDPTAPDIHLGHTVVLNMLRKFQDLGHVAMPLFGDYTALIGDPSGRNKTRPPLTEEQINTNAETYLEQTFKVLSEDKKVLDLRRNSEWLKGLTFADTIKLCAQATVAQVIEREDFAKRLAAHTPISMHELLYPLMQGYDSVAMACDIELGGTDQTFNCLMGRHLMHARQMTPQIVMTFPLLEGLDGVEKMSKSKNNYIGLTDTPNNMFGKIMSLPDELTVRYINLLTAVDSNTLPEHPMEAKKLLARTLITRFHDEKAAQGAEEDFTTRFSKREIPDNLPELTFSIGPGLGVLALLVKCGFTTSNSKARQLVQQGGVKQNGAAILDPQHTFTTPEEFVLQAGKRHMAKVTLTA